MVRLVFSMRPKISVVIPVYNGEKTIKDCLDSVLNQDYENYEIIVVNNNSTDSTSKILEKINNKKLRVLFETKKGRGAARNMGIKNSSGDLIAMIDSDCIAPKDWLYKISKPIIENGQSVVMGGEESMFSNYVSKNIQAANQKLIKENLQDNYLKHLDTKNIIFVKKVFENVMFDNDLKNLEDFDLFLQIDGNYKIYYLENVKVKHFHKENLIDWFKKQVDRGYNNSKIKEKYKNKKSFMFESNSLFNLIKLPFWLLFKLFSRPRDFVFILFSETGWRFGIIKYYLENERS